MRLQNYRFLLAVILWSIASGALAQARAPQVLQGRNVNAAVSLDVAVEADGTIVGTMTNNIGQKIGDVEVLVEYAWVWENDFNHSDDDPGWSMTYTLPVELEPGMSVPMNLAPLHPLPDRDDGQFLISAKVLGFTRYRWVSPSDY